MKPGHLTAAAPIVDDADWRAMYDQTSERMTMGWEASTDAGVAGPGGLHSAWWQFAGDEERLRAVSPVNFADRIEDPVLLIHGRDDRHVPVQQTRAMVAALARAGRKPEVLYLRDEGHNLTGEKNRTLAMERLVVFLEKHQRAPP